MSLVRIITNSILPIKNCEKRIGKDTANVVFTNSYVGSAKNNDGTGIDFIRVAADLQDPMIINRLQRVESISRPATALLATAVAFVALAAGINTIKQFPEGKYEIGPVTIRTGEAAEIQPPLCMSVQDDYLSDGFSMSYLGEVSELEDDFPIDNTCRDFAKVYAFVTAELN